MLPGFIGGVGGGAAGASGASGGFPWMSAAIGANTLGSLFGGGGGGDQQGQRQMVATGEQFALLKRLIAEMYGGGGDMLGPYLREGKGALEQMFANQNIPLGSGAYASAASRMSADAIAKAGQNRFQNLFSLMSTPPATIGEGAYDAIFDAKNTGGAGEWTPTGFQVSSPYSPPTDQLKHQFTGSGLEGIRRPSWQGRSSWRRGGSGGY